MTNLKIKKSHLAKSKIFITFLCIFGLAFSYGCRSDDGGGGFTDPTVITPSYSKGAILVADDSATTTPLSITFSNVDAKLDSVTVEGVADLSIVDFEYDGNALKLTGHFDKVTEERKKITAVFTLSAKNSGETLTKSTETVEALIVKKKDEATFYNKIIKDKLTALEKACGGVKTFEFYFNKSEIKDNKMSITNEKRYVADDDDTINPDDVINTFNEALNYSSLKAAIWTSAEFTTIDKIQVGGDRTGVISFTFKFTLADSYKAEYGIDTYDLTIEATAKSSDKLHGDKNKVGKCADTPAHLKVNSRKLKII